MRWWWRRSHPRSRIGVAVTLGYIVIMLLTVLVRAEDFLTLQLNALGDFLAGTFAPLALLWLVIGYFQQGDELRQNSRALLLQAEELRQAAEHAGGLLDVARKEHELAMEKLRVEGIKLEAAAKQQAEEQKRIQKRGIQPRIYFNLAFRDTNGEARMKLTNDGHDCTSFSLEIPENEVLNLMQPVEVKNLKARAAEFIHVKVLKSLGTTPVIAKWTDAEGDRFEKKYIASVAGSEINIDS